MNISKLVEIKNIIEDMNKEKQVEVLRLLKSNKVNISENKNGSFINLTAVDETIIDKLLKYIKYSSKQEEHLNELEQQKEDYKNIFFKEDKEVCI